MVKDGKRKILDGKTGRVSWRQGRAKGFLRDLDGSPTAKNYNLSGLKRRPKHTPHTGKSKKRKLEE